MLLRAKHQEITDDLELVQVAENYVDANDERKNILDQPITFLSIHVLTVIPSSTFVDSTHTAVYD